jgi:hypothetical protein
MASNRFFLNDNSSSSDESSDDKQAEQIPATKKIVGKTGAKSFVLLVYVDRKRSHFSFYLSIHSSASKPYFAMSDEDEDTKRVVRSGKTKVYD